MARDLKEWFQADLHDKYAVKHAACTNDTFQVLHLAEELVDTISTETVGKVPYLEYPVYIPGVFHTRVRVGIVGMTSENT